MLTFIFNRPHGSISCIDGGTRAVFRYTEQQYCDEKDEVRPDARWERFGPDGDGHGVSIARAQ